MNGGNFSIPFHVIGGSCGFVCFVYRIREVESLGQTICDRREATLLSVRVSPVRITFAHTYKTHINFGTCCCTFLNSMRIVG